jgi:hypothetical protein
VVQERLRHSDITLTLRLYIHVIMDMQRQAADLLDRTLNDAHPHAALEQLDINVTASMQQEAVNVLERSLERAI